jgi:hypothetical protein
MGADAREAAHEGAHGAIRTVLITFGVAAFTLLLSRHGFDAAPRALFTGAPAVGHMLVGVVVQVVLIIAHAIVKRLAPDSTTAAQGRFVVEIVGDGVTVLLFATGVLGATLHVASEI